MITNLINLFCSRHSHASFITALLLGKILYQYPLLGLDDEVVILHGHRDDAAVGGRFARVVVVVGVDARGAGV